MEAEEIKIDLNGLTWGDMEVLLGAGNGQMTAEMFAIFDRIVVGGVKHLPFFQTYRLVMDSVARSVEAMNNPVDGTGKN